MCQLHDSKLTQTRLQQIQLTSWDGAEVRFSADATWSVEATVSFDSTASLKLGVELLFRLTKTLDCNVPDELCK
jgi:hypothetical protein